MATEVEEKYDGPRLECEVTAKFMEELLQYLKDQKKLHKKYAFKVSQYVPVCSKLQLQLFGPDYLGSSEGV